MTYTEPNHDQACSPHCGDDPLCVAELKPPAGKRLISLSQNESLLPPSPLAIGAAAEAMSGTHLYPDPDWSALREALAELHNIPADKILCGNGSMELTASLTLAYANPQNAVLAPAQPIRFSELQRNWHRPDLISLRK